MSFTTKKTVIFQNSKPCVTKDMKKVQFSKTLATILIIIWFIFQAKMLDMAAASSV